MRTISRKAAYFITLAVSAGMIGFSVWRVKSGGRAKMESFGQQAAESALMMPVNGGPDLRFRSLGSWDALLIPKAVRFDPPLGSEQGALTFTDQKFWQNNDANGGHHTGDDLSGIGGANVDLGDPVFCVADGLVVYAGEPSPDWGNMVIIAHTAADGKPIQSMYAHLDRIEISKGALVGRGTKIGTVGTSNGYYPAHLHFEMRETEGIDIGGGYASQPLNRLDPADTVANYRNSPADFISPSPLGKISPIGK